MIKVENLSKAFGPKVAVDDVSFTVERGEILGFLGPNGAGKSTTMRMITGYIPPTAGVVRVGGNDVTEKPIDAKRLMGYLPESAPLYTDMTVEGFLGPNGAGKSTTMRMITGYIPPTAGVVKVGDNDVTEKPIEAKRLMGYLPESAPLYTDMTVEGFLGFCAEVRGINGADKAKAIDRAIDMCFLKSVRHQSVDTLSKGFRHRTGFAQAIIHDPDILVMDEPTDGLDPNQKHEVRSLIRRMGQSKAIIFSTHILEEVEAACTRAIIIDQGKIVANGTPDELKAKSELADSYVVSISGTEAAAVRDKLGSVIQAAKVTIVNDKAPTVVARVFPKKAGTDGELGQAIFAAAAQHNWKINEIKKEEGRLDDVFRNITLSDTKTQ